MLNAIFLVTKENTALHAIEVDQLLPLKTSELIQDLTFHKESKQN